VARFGEPSATLGAYLFLLTETDTTGATSMTDFDFGGWHGDELNDVNGVHDVPDLAAPGHFDLVGADPDENGLWDQLRFDLHDDANPYLDH
jgi:hypothetical protein